MMKSYARIDQGIVVEIILPWADENGDEVPIEQRFAHEPHLFKNRRCA